MNEKQNKHFYIDKESLDYLKEVKKDNNLSSMNQAINLVLKEHKEKSKTTTELMLKIIANEVATELKNELQKIILKRMLYFTVGLEIMKIITGFGIARMYYFLIHLLGCLVGYVLFKLIIYVKDKIFIKKVLV